MKQIIVAAVVCLTGIPALASEDEIIKIRADADVGATMDRLEAAVTNAGATIFARVDHAAGAQSVDMSLDPAELLVFGNPQLGTPAIQDDPLAGLYLPLRVLVYQDVEGQVWLAYDDPEQMFDDLAIPDDADYIERMSEALTNLTGAAASD